ncbi:hypothetical protein ACS0TY_007162 [Phlomoides rotata]
MTPIFEYLLRGTLPEESVQANRFRIKAARYIIIRDQLYKRGFSLPLLKCLTKEQGQLVLNEIHGGVYRNPFVHEFRGINIHLCTNLSSLSSFLVGVCIMLSRDADFVYVA